jgi:hypothetical protein
LIWTFQQDGDPAHEKRSTYYELHGLCKFLPKWPPNSPDLNVIEVKWGKMKKLLKKENPKTKKRSFISN